MYIIIDREYRIFQTTMCTAATRAACERGEISIVHINLEQLRVTGKNLPENEKLYGEEWSDIQPWAPIPLPDLRLITEQNEMGISSDT